MEGISGVVCDEQAAPFGSEYPAAHRWFMSDLNALLRGLSDGGADEIVICDLHYFGRNVTLDELVKTKAAVKLLVGKPLYTETWRGGLDSDFSGLILLGLHSKKGTEGALLNHTYEPDIRDIRINGLSVGEIGVEAAIAGDVGVPLCMITGDSEGVAEAKTLAPDVIGVTVKESLSENAALCYPTAETAERICLAAKEAAERAGGTPLVFRDGVTLEVVLQDTPYTKKYRELFGESVFRGASMTECWAAYQKNKRATEKAL